MSQVRTLQSAPFGELAEFGLLQLIWNQPEAVTSHMGSNPILSSKQNDNCFKGRLTVYRGVLKRLRGLPAKEIGVWRARAWVLIIVWLLMRIMVLLKRCFKKYGKVGEWLKPAPWKGVSIVSRNVRGFLSLPLRQIKNDESQVTVYILSGHFHIDNFSSCSQIGLAPAF